MDCKKEKSKVQIWIENGRVELSNGDVRWYKDGVLNRTDKDENGLVLPAVEYADGAKSWWENGQKHREGGLPAVEMADGSKEWYKDGSLHRMDGAAIEKSDGTKHWYENGKRHREGGLPAVEKADGARWWYYNDNLHRMDGPAVMRSDGFRRWYIEGVEVEKERHPWWVSEQEKKRLSEAMAMIMTAPCMFVNCSGDVVLNDECKKDKKKLGL